MPPSPPNCTNKTTAPPDSRHHFSSQSRLDSNQVRQLVHNTQPFPSHALLFFFSRYPFPSQTHQRPPSSTSRFRPSLFVIGRHSLPSSRPRSNRSLASVAQPTTSRRPPFPLPPSLTKQTPLAAFADRRPPNCRADLHLLHRFCDKGRPHLHPQQPPLSPFSTVALPDRRRIPPPLPAPRLRSAPGKEHWSIENGARNHQVRPPALPLLVPSAARPRGPLVAVAVAHSHPPRFKHPSPWQHCRRPLCLEYFLLNAT